MNTREVVAYYRRLRKERGNEELTFQEAREEVETFFDLIGDIVAMDEEIKFKNKGNFVGKCIADNTAYHGSSHSHHNCNCRVNAQIQCFFKANNCKNANTNGVK